jgi:xanthine phosphoribosyltransferase
VDVETVSITWENLEFLVKKLSQDLQNSNWIPDYIVGIVRGGVVPAVMLSHELGIPMWTLKVSLRDDNEYETNCWMPEDAINGKRILIVDDINDSGETLAWIRDDWQSSIAGIITADDWMNIWNNQVRIAVVVNNAGSTEVVSYRGMEIDKRIDPRWIIFPYESKYSIDKAII